MFFYDLSAIMKIASINTLNILKDCMKAMQH